MSKLRIMTSYAPLQFEETEADFATTRITDIRFISVRPAKPREVEGFRGQTIGDEEFYQAALKVVYFAERLYGEDEEAAARASTLFVQEHRLLRWEDAPGTNRVIGLIIDQVTRGLDGNS